MAVYDPLYFWVIASSFLLLTVILNFCVGKFGVIYVEKEHYINYSYSYPMVMTYIFFGFIPILTASAYYDVNGVLVLACILGGFVANTLAMFSGYLLEKRKLKKVKSKQRNEDENPAV